jgi:hypothetical protein
VQSDEFGHCIRAWCDRLDLPLAGAIDRHILKVPG